MAFSIPDKGEPLNDLQSIFFQEQLEMLVEGIDGRNCVLSGGAVTPSSLLTVAIAKAAVLSAGTLFAVAATTIAVGTADATNPRLDMIVVNSSGTVAVRAGTAAASPKPAVRTANDVVLAMIYVSATLTTVASGNIVDMRVVRAQGPIVIYKTTTAETTNTTAAAIHALNKANSGVTIPDGLFLTGKILRVRIGGNMLVNSGTPTIIVAVLYGGTTMFSDTSAASTADADRRPWFLEFNVVAQANNDQAMIGHMQTAAVAGLTAPATGIGDIWSTAMAAGELGGSAAVDSDAANRLLAVTVTFSVSNAANQLVVEYATVELL
jgi:hypothetical protein